MNKVCCVDYLGQMWDSKEEMCRYYGRSVGCFDVRMLKSNGDLEYALSWPLYASYESYLESKKKEISSGAEGTPKDFLRKAQEKIKRVKVVEPSMEDSSKIVTAPKKEEKEENRGNETFMRNVIEVFRNISIMLKDEDIFKNLSDSELSDTIFSLLKLVNKETASIA